MRIALLAIRGCRRIIGNKNRCNTTKELVHMNMCGVPRGLLFVDKSLCKGVLAISHYTNENPGWCGLPGIRINDLGGISGPVNLDLLTGFPRNVHGGSPLLLILLDVIVELRVHERIFAILSAFVSGSPSGHPQETSAVVAQHLSSFHPMARKYPIPWLDVES